MRRTEQRRIFTEARASSEQARAALQDRFRGEPVPPEFGHHMVAVGDEFSTAVVGIQQAISNFCTPQRTSLRQRVMGIDPATPEGHVIVTVEPDGTFSPETPYEAVMTAYHSVSRRPAPDERRLALLRRYGFYPAEGYEEVLASEMRQQDTVPPYPSPLHQGTRRLFRDANGEPLPVPSLEERQRWLRALYAVPRAGLLYPAAGDRVQQMYERDPHVVISGELVPGGDLPPTGKGDPLADVLGAAQRALDSIDAVLEET